MIIDKICLFQQEKNRKPVLAGEGGGGLKLFYFSTQRNYFFFVFFNSDAALSYDLVLEGSGPDDSAVGEDQQELFSIFR